MSTPVIIDTDGGVDDAAALWWAVTNPALDVVAVTVVWGNVPVEVATVSVLRVLAAAGRSDVPVAVGLGEPIGPAPYLRPASFIHGEDGLGNTTDGLPPPSVAAVDEPALDLLRRVCAAQPGEVSLVTLGPLSNVGQLVRDDASFAANVRELVVMGGSARAGGNASPNGEANIAHDPVAAALVGAAGWGVLPLMVGLDVTMAATLTDDHFAVLAAHRNAAATFLDGPLRFYRSVRHGTSATCPCHDLLAVMAFAQPEILTEAPVLPMAVDTCGGPSWGATVVDTRGGPAETGFDEWRVALGVDVRAFRDQAARLFGGE